MTTDFEGLSLGVITHKDCWRDPEGIKTTGGFGRQMEELSRYFKKTTLLVPFEEISEPRAGYAINIDNLRVIPFPLFDGTGLSGKLDFLIKLPGILFQIWRAYPLCDVWQFRLPGYVGLLGVLTHKIRRSRRCFIWLGTDWAERIKESGNALFRRWMARVANNLINWALKDIPTFALGELADKHGSSNPYAHSTISTITSMADFKPEPKSDLASPPRLLFVGRLALEKGVFDLLEAVHLANHQGLPLDLTIIGDGPERERLERLTARHGLQGQVHFKGYVPAGGVLWQWYTQADMFILPSLSEAQGKVLIEAMSAGLPIIATRVGGIPSLIEHEKTGLLAPPHSPEGLLEEIRSLIQDPAKRRRLTENALAAARSYTIEGQTKKMMMQLADDFLALGWR